MSDNRFASNSCHSKETVCIETNKILDSCRDRDCFENVRVYLTDFGQEIIEHTSNVRVKCAEIGWTNINVEPVQFNHGFYTITIRFYIKLELEACINGRAQEFQGIAVLEKNVVLFGSESNVNIFKSGKCSADFCARPVPVCGERSVPEAIIEVVDPIVLGVKVVEHIQECNCCCCCSCDIPNGVCAELEQVLGKDDDYRRYLAVSFGLFSVIRLVRPAQYLIQATEYCVPDKECITSDASDPCSVFRHMPFPSAEFCPPAYCGEIKGDRAGNCGCS
ncbi:MAG: hypothetical protein J6R46_06430 [Clostridia bacterium]|nr:hypothetical protein [Clostridia bacterium]